MSTSQVLRQIKNKDILIYAILPSFRKKNSWSMAFYGCRETTDNLLSSEQMVSLLEEFPLSKLLGSQDIL